VLGSDPALATRAQELLATVSDYRACHDRLARGYRGETGYGEPDATCRAIVRRCASDVARRARGCAVVRRTPGEKGQRLGRVEVYDGNRLVASSGLVAARSVAEPGLLGKARWYATQTAANLWGLVT
jgi:hypothetical protein